VLLSIFIVWELSRPLDAQWHTNSSCVYMSRALSLESGAYGVPYMETYINMSPYTAHKCFHIRHTVETYIPMSCMKTFMFRIWRHHLCAVYGDIHKREWRIWCAVYGDIHKYMETSFMCRIWRHHLCAVYGDIQSRHIYP